MTVLLESERSGLIDNQVNLVYCFVGATPFKLSWLMLRTVVESAV